MSSQADTPLDEVIRKCLDGEGVAILGAGFSCGATNVAGSAIKSASELAAQLAAAVSLPADAPLTDLADYYLETRGTSSLVSLMKQEFEVSSITEEHKAVASIAWRRVYTTNYDDVFELASRATPGRSATSIVPSDSTQTIGDRTRACIHINGAVSRLRADDLRETFRLTDTSYAATSFGTTAWAQQFLLDVQAASVVLVVGYSLYDIDLRRLLVESDVGRSKTFFVCGKSLGPIAVHKLNRHGTVLDEDLANLALRIRACQETHTPRTRPRHTVESLDPIRVIDTPATSNVRDLRDLLLFGYMSHDYLWQDIDKHGAAKYVCQRNGLENALRALRDGLDVVVRGELGNGKTVFLETLGVNAAAAGFLVYRLRAAASDAAIGAMAEFLRGLERAVVLVDAYATKRKEIEAIARVRGNSVRLVLTARTIDHDVSAHWLESTLSKAPIELCVDQLAGAELEWFCNVLDENGLWRESATKTHAQKIDDLQHRRFRGELSSILIELIRSPAMARRIDEVFAEIESDKDVIDPVVAVLILSVVEQEASEQTLAALIGAEAVNRARFRNSPAVRVFLSSQAGVFSSRSAVLATYILKHRVHPARTIRILGSMVRAAEDRGAADLRLRNMGKELLRAARVQAVLPDGNVGAMLDFYEDMRTVQSSQGNPQFWLQYAIALMAVKQYEDARTKLDTAYALAKRSRTYNTFMLDNVQARWLLEDSCRHDLSPLSAETAMGRFREARDILVGQLATAAEDRHYPYRVAKSYKDFFHHYAHALSVDQKHEIIRAAKHVVRTADQIRGDLATKPRVRDCRDTLAALIRESGLDVLPLVRSPLGQGDGTAPVSQAPAADGVKK